MTGRHHQRRRPIRAGDPCVGAGSGQHLHDFDVRVLGREEEGRRAEPVQPAALAVFHAVLRHPLVQVDAVRNHLLDEVNAVERAGRLRPWRRPEVRPTALDRLVQGVPSCPCEIRVRAAIEEEIRELPVRVGRRHNQRALAVRGFVVHVRARVKELAHRAGRSCPDREQQGREPRRRRTVEDGETLTRCPGGAARSNRQIGPRLHKHANSRGVILLRRPT